MNWKVRRTGIIEPAIEEKFACCLGVCGCWKYFYSFAGGTNGLSIASLKGGDELPDLYLYL